MFSSIRAMNTEDNSLLIVHQIEIEISSNLVFLLSSPPAQFSICVNILGKKYQSSAIKCGATLYFQSVTFEEWRHFCTAFVYCAPYRWAVCLRCQTASRAGAECDWRKRPCRAVGAAWVTGLWLKLLCNLRTKRWSGAWAWLVRAVHRLFLLGSFGSLWKMQPPQAWYSSAMAFTDRNTQY